jgi:hypothetical protein
VADFGGSPVRHGSRDSGTEVADLVVETAHDVSLIGPIYKQQTKEKYRGLMPNRDSSRLQEVFSVFDLPGEGCHRGLPEATRHADNAAKGAAD